MKLDQWMSEFYGMQWYRLDSLDDSRLCKEEGLYELRLLSDDFSGIIEAQKNGFSLVESFIEFETKWYKWREKIIKLSKSELILEHQEKKYHYTRFSYDLN